MGNDGIVQEKGGANIYIKQNTLLKQKTETYVNIITLHILHNAWEYIL